MGRFIPPDHSKGDESTLGGYMAVHDRPAAFEGSDGISYSVEILAEKVTDALGLWGAYLLFLRWARIGEQVVEGHLETDFLAWADDEAEARARVGRMPLGEVKSVLEGLLATRRAAQPSRPWWDAMRDEDPAE